MALTDEAAPVGHAGMQVARHHRALTHRWILPVALAAIIVAGAVVASLQLTSARHHLQHGTQILRSATLRLSGQWYSATGRAHLRTALIRADREFASARSDIRLWTPFLGHMGWVPFVGYELAAAQSASDAAFYTARSALHLMDGLDRLWPALAQPRPSSPFLARVLPALNSGNAQFRMAQQDAILANMAMLELPVHSGNAALDAVRVSLRNKLPLLDATSRWLAITPALLGARRPGHFLVLLQDAAELRATGGFIGAADFMTVGQGSMESTFTGSSLPHEIASVSPPLPEALYTAEAYWIFRDANWSPDFSVSARLARWFYGEDTGRWADGVVGVEDAAIARLLIGTGPVYLPAYGRRVTAGNVEALAQQYVNGAYHGPLTAGSPDTMRKQFFGDVIQALTNRVQHLPLQRWRALGAALSDAITRREIMLYDRRPAVESAIRASGAGGLLTYPGGDFLAVVDDNRSYNKLNPYVDEQASYDVVVRRNLWLDATLTLRYHVHPSPANLEGAGPGFGNWGTKHDYQDFLRVYVPPGARLATMTGLDMWAPVPAYGLTQFAGRLIVRQGQTRTVHIRYAVPANALASGGADSYRLTIRPQPGATLQSVRVRVRGVRDLRIGRLAQRGTPTAGIVDLAGDAHLTLPILGPFHPDVIRLHGASQRADPYLPYGDLRDSKHPW